ncbi:MAG: helix-turn-helix domain-containing protein [Elusimicrobia bacterium]|nr:helix-turn-helix domain-containing protein [Elusimicrobiota bacterium]
MDMTNFSRSFVRMRALRGFRTAYAFYNSNGGRRVFPFTYSHYLKIERGGCLPSLPALALMLQLLRREVSPQERGRLMRDYLRDLCGSALVFDQLFALLLPPAGEIADASALDCLQGRLAVHLTPNQFRAFVSSPEATGCFLVLANVPEALSVEQIAGWIGSSREKCLKALKELRRQGLLRARGRDRYSALSPGRHYLFPSSHGLEPFYKKMRKNVDRLAARHGKPLSSISSVVRLSPQAIAAAIEGFAKTSSVSVGLSQKMTPAGLGSDICELEARVRRLVAF